jgi:hypothetical protein
VAGYCETRREISWLAERILVSESVLLCMELITESKIMCRGKIIYSNISLICNRIDIKIIGVNNLCDIFNVNRDGLVGIATGYGRQRCRSSSPSSVKNFRFSTLSRPSLGSTQPPI